MKRIMNHSSELVNQILGKKGNTDGLSWIQKKILNNKYHGKKQNELRGNQPIINHFPLKLG